MKRILAVLLIILICISLTIVSVSAATVDVVDYTYLPFDTIPYPSEVDEKYNEYTNLTLFYYDYTSLTYYAVYTKENVNLQSKLSLYASDDVGGHHKSGNLYKSDTDKSSYTSVTLTYTMTSDDSASTWVTDGISSSYVYVTCVTAKMDVLYYGGEVEYSIVIDENTDTEEEKQKAWYDYLADIIINGFESLLRPIYGGVTDLVTLLQDQNKFLSLFQNFFDIFEEWSSGFEEQWNEITEFFENLDNKTVDFIKSIWEFPIIKELTVGLVALIIVSAILALLKSGV